MASRSLTRAASRSLIACFRRDSARRSYRSNAGSARATSLRIATSLSGPSSFESRSLSSSSGICSPRAHFRAIRRATATFLFQFARVSYFRSARAREMRSWRSDRTRRTSIFSSAKRRAGSSISEGASAPAIWRARTAIASAVAGSGWAGTLRPWRNAFFAERARPLAVLGPVLERAFARFDFVLMTLVTAASFHRWMCFR